MVVMLQSMLVSRKQSRKYFTQVSPLKAYLALLLLVWAQIRLGIRGFP